MPAVYPFRALQFPLQSGKAVTDLSSLIAPPYDVLNEEAKRALLAKNPLNIVSIDLPHLPTKVLGPDEAYARAGNDFAERLRTGGLIRRSSPAMFVYRQTFTSAGRECQRVGMACTIETVPFGPRAGGGVLPHEETFSGPKEDRLALMHATKAQLSPVFGLHQDESGAASALVRTIAASRSPDIIARTDDGVLHEVWTIDDPATHAAYAAALANEDLFIADGHHRYTTAINYLKQLEALGTPVPADHPARRTLIVLVGMSDPGLTIWPTHRVLGGMARYSWEAFKAAAAEHFQLAPVVGGLAELERALNTRSNHETGTDSPIRLGLFDFASGSGAIATPLVPDPLAVEHSYKPLAWRMLDVAVVQHLLVENICQPVLNDGLSVRWSFPHTLREVEALARGESMGAGESAGQLPQLGVILRATPLESVREICRAGELMPQKSTFFFPKLATGLFLNALT